MAHHQAEGAAGKAPIGDQGHRIQQALAHDRGGGAEHLAHAGAAHGPFLSHHHHIAGVDLLVEDGGQTGLLAFEHPCRACDHRVLNSADLGHGTLLRQVPLEDRQVPLGIERVAERADHVLAGGRLGGHIRQHLLQGLALNGSAVAVEQARIQEQLHHLGNAPGLVQIHGHVATAGLEIADHRHPLADCLEVLDAQVHASCAGHRQQVKH